MPPNLDPAQSRVAARLDALLLNLRQPGRSFFDRLLNRNKQVPKGIYVWGSVGRGKTMLMDHFFARAPDLPKRRVHFHAFMQEVHAARAKHRSTDVIADVAEDVAARSRILCLDEMQVSDIADAMILGRLFEALLARGVVLVTTSNTKPDDLYKEGLNRQLFLPFIAKLKAALEVVHLANGVDYRLGRVAAHETYVTPLDPKADAALDALWGKLTDGEEGKPRDIEILGRKLQVPHAAHSCARFGFGDLVENPLGAPDFLAIAQNFRTVFVDHVRVFKAAERNQAKRFILLVDTLYDAGARLVVSAETEPEKLCVTGSHKSEFVRTASRLREMQSQGWWHRR